MSRARNIKPGFFRNEVLVELPFEVRLLFIGLWTIADRRGRLEDRPVRIRMELFPADSVDVEAGLQSLHDRGFILRYAVGGLRYIQILAWAKHQNPHHKEAESVIPPPPLPEALGSCMSVEPEACTGMHDSKAPDKHEALTSTHAIPSPPNRADSLIPDSLIPDSLQELSADASGNPADSESIDLIGSSIKLGKQPPWQPIINAYHRLLPSCLRATVMNPKRKRRLAEAVKLAKTLCKSQGWPYDAPQFWDAYFRECAKDPWMRGETPNPKNPAWRQNLDVLLAEDRFAKLMDGALDAMRCEA